MKTFGRSVWLLPAVGLASLAWFLLRVIPKPSRAAYPCQRVAAPLAGSFLLWLGGIVMTAVAFRHAKRLSRQSRRIAAGLMAAIALVAGILAIAHTPQEPLNAAAMLAPAPIGIARGVSPGRVVWVHEPAATDWAGPGNGHWWEDSHTKQIFVDNMLSAAVRTLAGQATDAAAWDALIRHFNQTHGKGDVGYTPGEKICIKVNLVGCIASGGSVDPVTYNLVGQLDYMNTSPQVMRALLRQLVNAVGVNPADISIGDPTALFPNQYYNLLYSEFPTVRYLDRNGGNDAHPRTAVNLSTVPFYWSPRPTGKTQDYVPAPYAEAAYLINVANLKSHTAGGVTVCGKNHFGSLKRYPATSGYFSMHDSLPQFSSASGRYRCIVDLMGHDHVGGKTLAWFIDGLYAGVHPIESSPRRWNTAPFNGDWTSSLFASQDPVAIDSVAFDFLYNEWTDYPRMAGTDDYLHEAALASGPPSGTFYDPNHPFATTRLASLGVHEHWNNATYRQYSRNLGTGDGIELIPLRVGGDFDQDGDADMADFTLFQLCFNGPNRSPNTYCAVDADFDDDGDVDLVDFGAFQACFNGPNRPPSCL